MLLQFVFFLLILSTTTARPQVESNCTEIKNKSLFYQTRSLLFSPRIVGGVDAERHEFPHIVSLQYGRPPHFYHLCGGTILNRRWILTAAHCTSTPLGPPKYIKAGIHSVYATAKPVQFKRISSVYHHKNYDKKISPYDIALIRLRDTLVYNEFVGPINLPKPYSQVSGDVVLAGWGIIDPESNKAADNLQIAKLPIISNDECKELIKNLIGQTVPIYPLNVCTGNRDKVSGCGGDSGGPLIKVYEDGGKEIVGIVSWGLKPCGTEKAPTVYVRVSHFISWINGILKNKS